MGPAAVDSSGFGGSGLWVRRPTWPSPSVRFEAKAKRVTAARRRPWLDCHCAHTEESDQQAAPKEKAAKGAVQGERMAAAVASLYRRVLPSPPAVDFASPEGKRLFAEALAAGTMEGFFPLVSCFQTQSEPAFCGLASLAVVLNALAIDPGRRWKGPWRWFDESMLDCCEPLDKVKAEGITFGKVACLARCSGANENVLQQVRDTKLFAIVHDQQYANNPCCNCSSSSEEDSLTRIAAAVCCQGAAMLSGNLASRHGFCCRETCLKCIQTNGDGLKTVISASVVSEGNEQGVDVLLPMSSPDASSCNSNLKNNVVKYPSSADALTVLLLALHPSIWLGIKDDKLKTELQTLVSTDNLPDDLKREIMHLRRQLYYLKACKDKEEYEDDDPPSPK
ncbi:hypothetical protein HU200_055926 [Digitaria exilis]|uniref:glutathione gamma-glutamylcysteinyltransferase n=1 Tax=Digitaria exilis TaxID=1010633 RepID=A0A835AE42_9POAL|nr:hypothetical protein HU200_055926 [Digitaria exilis]